MVSTRFPATWAELGADLQRIRGDGRSLRDVAKQVFASKSTLQRFEAGAAVSDRAARALDAFYGTEGWILISVTRLTLTTWSPWRRELPSRFRAYRWPAEFDGMVWLEVRPADGVATPLEVSLSWGPWRRRWAGTVPAAGVILWTDKSEDDDGVAVPLRVQLDRPAYVRFGADEVDDPRFTDISTGWWKTPSEA